MADKEIQVGEYVRCSLYGIGKVYMVGPVEEKGTKYEYQKIMLDTNGNLKIADSDFITNHDFNIIKLIEKGDYVNGTLILAIEESTYTKIGRKAIRILVYRDHRQDCWDTLFEEDIKSIVTKEQFKSMEYKVGGEDE